jgi:hypothetical protein
MDMDNNSQGASVWDRICGATAAVLTIGFFTSANLTHDAQWQMTCMVAGFFYFLTTIGKVFEHGMVAHHKGPPSPPST